MATLHIHQDIINAIKKEVLLAAYPVGSIYFSNKNTNPSSLFGGTWVAWGSGRVPVGVNTSDSNFNTVEKTGGAATNTHYHDFDDQTHASIRVYENLLVYSDKKLSTTWKPVFKAKLATYGELNNETHDTAVKIEGKTKNSSTSSLQPYITCYMWKRTA